MISPMVRRRRLAAELRQLRVEAKLTNAALCKKLGWSPTKISRMENATYPPNMADVMKLLRELDVPSTRAHRITEIAREAAERGWWQDFGEHMGARQRVNADLEWGAQTIAEYMNVVIPGALQSAEYTRSRGRIAMLRGERTSEKDLDLTVEARLARQQMLRRPDGPKYEAIVDEIILMRPQVPREIMREQLLQLAETAEQDPSIVVRMLPVKVEVEDHWLPVSSFSAYTYPEPDDPDVVLLEGEAADTVLSDEVEVAPYRQLFDRLRAASLEPSETVIRLRTAAADI
ncbi:MAG: helix-turn-helix domain-containing protein [Stackebrandtia sp.]